MDDFVIESLENIKQAWLRKNQATLDALPETIGESWNRSLAFGVDPDSPHLPPIADWVDGYAARGQDPIAGIGSAGFARSLEELCAESRIAFAFANRSLRLIGMIGHPSVLKRLAERNIDRGASLSERSAGTNALSLAPFLNARTVLGSGEHFSRAFEGFSTTANAPSTKSSVRVMALVPDKLDAETLAPIVNLVLDACDIAFEDEEASTANLMGNVFFEELLEERRMSCMVADAAGRVLSQSKRFAADVAGRCSLDKGSDASGFVRMLEPLPAAFRARTGKGRAIGMLRTGPKEFVARCFSSPAASGETVYTLHEVPSIGISPHTALADPDSLHGEGERMDELKRQIERAAQTSACVLVSGEPGTEKTLAARIIHNLHDPQEPFVHLDISSLEQGDIPAALFGCAMPGKRERPGALARAKGGTLYLSSVEDIPLTAQARLATVLLSSTFTSVDGFDPHPLEARVIASSCSDLSRLALQGMFRTDLLYLLDVVRIETVPLRDRSDGFESLLARLAEEEAANAGRKPLAFSESAVRALKEYAWPGNLHELRNVLAKLHCRTADGPVTPRELPARIVAGIPTESGKHAVSQACPAGSMQSSEEASLRNVLERIGDNKTECARVLGISRQTLYNRMRKYGMVDE